MRKGRKLLVTIACWAVLSALAALLLPEPEPQYHNFKVQAGLRTESGEAEIHDHDTDIFYIVEGSATFVTGGKPVDSRTVSPGETRAKSIAGGTEQKLTKGDIIVIPTGVPHWFKEVSGGPFLYYVVKVSK